jgi:DNA-binding XRE family transcriptional regulator
MVDMRHIYLVQRTEHGRCFPLSDAQVEGLRLVLAHRVAQLRNEANLSQRQAAARAGIDQRNWSRIEAGESFPRLDSLLRVQWALGLNSLEQLLGPGATETLLGGSASAAAGHDD